MINRLSRETAKIYRFPTRARLARMEADRGGQATAARICAVGDCGSGWYHEAAIQDDLRSRKS